MKKLRLTPAQGLLALEELHERRATHPSNLDIMTDWFRSLTSIIEIRIPPRPNGMIAETIRDDFFNSSRPSSASSRDGVPPAPSPRLPLYPSARTPLPLRVRLHLLRLAAVPASASLILRSNLPSARHASEMLRDSPPPDRPVEGYETSKLITSDTDLERKCLA